MLCVCEIALSLGSYLGYGVCLSSFKDDVVMTMTVMR